MTDKKAVWTDELKAEAVAMYVERIEMHAEDERANFTTQVTADVADELGFKVNSVRACLSRAKREDGSDVYVRKAQAKTATSTTAAGGAKRMSKADAQAELVNTLKTLGAPLSPELSEQIEKMTGKLAQALTASLTQIEG